MPTKHLFQEPVWPSMRGGHHNRGRMRVSPVLRTDLPIRHFRTGNAVFSTPVIGADETLYVGSADHRMYAFDLLTGQQRWQYDTGEIIDSAAAIGGDGSVYVPTGNGLYAFTRDGRKKWHIDLLLDGLHASPSTIYWWEGNAVVGPNGWVYAGCDDFHMYAVDPQGEVRWKTLTGCCVWTAACFGPDDTLYVASFDFHLYAFDMHTGRVKWTRNMKNIVVSSPVLGHDGNLYVGSFDGFLYTLDPSNGEILRSMQVGGPIYGTPAIDDAGLLYVGSADGNVYCIDPIAHAIYWSFYTGDSIRCSGVIGPDPEGEYPFLFYIGSGTGTLYAFEPTGVCRWSYDTFAGGPLQARSRNINASIALGRSGLATASANGDIIYVPYTVARTHVGHPGFTLFPAEPYRERSSPLYPVSISGAVSTVPAHGTAIKAFPGDTVSLRLIHHEDGRIQPATIDPQSVRVDLPDGISYRTVVTPDGSQVSLLPERAMPPGKHDVLMHASYQAENGQRFVLARCTIDVRPVSHPAAVEGLKFRIEHMSIDAPSIIASFDQIGIASLAIDVTIVRFDLSTGKVVAWGVQKFGFGRDGAPVAGIPVPRSLHFAFEGTYRDGTLILEARECQFEITAFPVPLNRLRFTALVTEEGVVGRSMVAEVRLRSALWRVLLGWIPAPRRGAGRMFVRRLRQGWGVLAAAFPDDDPLVGIVTLGSATWRVLYQAFWVLAVRVWRPWGMVRGGRFTGVGTFRAVSSPLSAQDGLKAAEFSFDRARHEIVAYFEADPSYDRGDACPGVLLLDRSTGLPLPCDYPLTLQVERDARNIPTSLMLELPADLDLQRGVDAVLFVDLEERATLSLDAA